ncbi:MAG: uracil-DNA glycosylase [Rickettsiales bacterium]|nr:uracil-DNA glycosylase [Rickettsiales bacterium]
MFTPPPANCPLCPRLVAFRAANAQQFPQFFNGAVPPFGSLDAQMLVVGLAPGLKGANASGRPFTGDFAGDVLYAALAKHGFASGEYDPSKFIAKAGTGHVSPHRAGSQRSSESFDERGADSKGLLSGSPHPILLARQGEGMPHSRSSDNFTLHNVRITNAVRCVPPENKPTPAEEKTCNPFLISEIAAMPNLKLILSLGLTSHQAVLRTFKLKARDYKFAHGAVHELVASRQSPVAIKTIDAPLAHHSLLTTHDSRLLLLDSYHTSRYNVSTGRLTQAMFELVVAQAKAMI